MSITSTLTTIASAGSGGSVSYWINQAYIARAYGWAQPCKMAVSPDHVVVFGREQVENSYTGSGILVYDQDGTQLSTKLFWNNSGQSASDRTEPTSAIYDESTSTFYTPNYGPAGASQLSRWQMGSNNLLSSIYCKSGSGGSDTFPSEITSTGSNQVSYFSRDTLPSSSWYGTVYNVAYKSSGSHVMRYVIGGYNYNYYPTCGSFEQYNSTPTYGYLGFQFYQSGLKGGVTKFNLSNGTTEWGRRLQFDDGWGNNYSGRPIAACPDDSGNVLCGFDFQGGNNPLILLNSSGSVVWSRSSDSEIIRIDWDNVNDRWVILTAYRMSLEFIYPNGNTAQALETNIPALDMNYGNSDVKYDFENNIAWITGRRNGDYKYIVKRPLDSSLDGTYGSFTLATRNSYIGTSYTYGYFWQNVSMTAYSKTVSTTNKSINQITNYVFTTKTGLG